MVKVRFESTKMPKISALMEYQPGIWQVVQVVHDEGSFEEQQQVQEREHAVAREAARQEEEARRQLAALQEQQREQQRRWEAQMAQTKQWEVELAEQQADAEHWDAALVRLEYVFRICIDHVSANPGSQKSWSSA